MAAIQPKHQADDEPVPGYCLTSLVESGPWDLECWEAVGPAGERVRMTIITVREEIQQGLLEWFVVLPFFRRIRHPHLLPLPELWLRTADGQLLNELPACPAASPDSAGARPPDAGADIPPAGPVATLQVGEAIEIEASSRCFRNLRDRLTEYRELGQQGIPWPELVDYLKGAAHALDYLHDPVHDVGHGPEAIIHGGIRPHDIVIVGDTVKVADWVNLVKWKAFEGHHRMTPSGAVRTIAYTAPEVLAGTPHVASDQYSLAVVYTALRTCALPFRKGTTPSDMIQLIQRGELDFSRLTKPERRVMQKATARDPEKRWPSCGYLVRALREAHDT